MINTMQRFYLQMTTSANFGTNVVNVQSDHRIGDFLGVVTGDRCPCIQSTLCFGCTHLPCVHYALSFYCVHYVCFIGYKVHYVLQLLVSLSYADLRDWITSCDLSCLL